MEAILFVLIAVIIAYFIDRIQAGEARYRTVFEYSQLGSCSSTKRASPSGRSMTSLPACSIILPTRLQQNPSSTCC